MFSLKFHMTIVWNLICTLVTDLWFEGKSLFKNELTQHISRKFMCLTNDKIEQL